MICGAGETFRWKTKRSSRSWPRRDAWTGRAWEGWGFAGETGGEGACVERAFEEEEGGPCSSRGEPPAPRLGLLAAEAAALPSRVERARSPSLPLGVAARSTPGP